MKFTADHDTARITRTVKVTDGPVHSQNTSHTGKQFRADRVEVNYLLRGTQWVVDSGYSISLGGPVLKKDGTDSKIYHRGHAPAAPHRLPVEWEWLADLVDKLRPVDFPLLPEVE